jgi:hypothetical protein
MIRESEFHRLSFRMYSTVSFAQTRCVPELPVEPDLASRLFKQYVMLMAGP